MRDALACVHISERLAHEGFHDEVAERQDNLRDQDAHEQQHPTALPRQPRQRAEQDGIEEIARRMQLQFGGALRAACGQARAPLVIVERVESADDALNREQPERDDHGCVSFTSTTPVYEINRPMAGRAGPTDAAMPQLKLLLQPRAPLVTGTVVIAGFQSSSARGTT